MSYERLHAMMYADHATRLYQLEKFKRMYPNLFVHAVVETRPAESARDYYVPSTLRECRIVEKLAWNEQGCRFVSCFPFTEYEKPCEPNAMQWVKVDHFLYVPACQPACDRGFSLDTQYRDGDCYVSNQAKKLYVMHPEQYNGMVAKHVRLTYDQKNDRLSLNPLYCDAYGHRYSFTAEECFVPPGQQFSEIFIGSSIYRRHLALPHATHKNDKNPPPPPDRFKEFEEAWSHVPQSTETADQDKTTDFPETVLESDLDATSSKVPASKIAAEIAAEIGADLGVQIPTGALTRKISKRLATKILSRNGLKHAFLHGVVKSMGSKTAAMVGKTTLSKMTGKVLSMMALRAGLSLASAAYTVYGVVSLMIDVFDPYEYEKMLTKEQLDKIDRLLDLRYFETDDFRNVKMTPEDVWDVLQDERDFEDELSFYGDRYDEYLDAIQTVPKLRKIDISPTPVVVVSEDVRKPHWMWIIGILCSGLFCLRLIDYVAFIILCVMLIWNLKT